MNIPALTVQAFLGTFPEFNGNQYIDMMIGRATIYVDIHCGCICNKQKQYAIFLLTAHLLTLYKGITSGEATGGVQTGASIDKVSVSYAPPPYANGFEYWLNQTPYGQELLALINILVATPDYIGGSFQRVL